MKTKWCLLPCDGSRGICLFILFLSNKHFSSTYHLLLSSGSTMVKTAPVFKSSKKTRTEANYSLVSTQQGWAWRLPREHRRGNSMRFEWQMGVCVCVCVCVCVYTQPRKGWCHHFWVLEFLFLKTHLYVLNFKNSLQLWILRFGKDILAL